MAAPEYFDDITALVDAIAEGLGLDPTETAKALESETITLSFQEDPSGGRQIVASYENRQVPITAAAVETARQRRAGGQ